LGFLGNIKVMRLFLLVLGIVSGLAWAGPDGLYFSKQHRIVDGQIRVVETLERVRIRGMGEIDTVLQKAARPAGGAQTVYDEALGQWFVADQIGHFFAPKRAKELYRVALAVGLNEFFLPVAYQNPGQGVKAYYDLGIRELLAEATTRFAGSSLERSFNIGLGASKLNGYKVAPGQVFSFAQAMGPVTEAAGFKKAFVISGEQTVEGVGGGMCQVSTTLFRSVYFAGLPIVQRRPHSYQVRYYLPTGLDAAVFLPQLDLKFKNDTPGTLLIQSSVGRTGVTFRVFGTRNRKVSWVGPYTSRFIPAPRTRFIVTPELRTQAFRQVDWAADGAVVNVYRTVKFDDGQVTKDTLTSVYRPWGAVWLVGSGTRLRSGRVLYAETDDAPRGHSYRLPTQTSR
jgi:vancomycin resistance protein YoaR